MKSSTRISAGLLAAVVLSLVSAGDASATAFGSTPIGTFEYEFSGVEIKIPTGCFLSHAIVGEGLNVRSQTVGADCVGLAATAKYCNWRFDLAYEDVEGRTYLSSPGENSDTCDYAPGRTDLTSRVLQAYGKACVRFFVGNIERSVMCHNIVKS